MEKLGYIISIVGDPMTLLALLLGVGLPFMILPAPANQVIAVGVVAAILAFNFWIDRSTRRLALRNGTGAVRGRIAVVVEPLAPAGQIKLDGELWNAVEEHGRWVDRGEQVAVVGLRGLELRVVRRRQRQLQ